jgi:DNA-binding FrmR family transcriptional regulator
VPARDRAAVTGPQECSGCFARLDAAQRKDVRDRLRRASGQIGGVVKMVEEEKGSVAIAGELAAAAKALRRANAVIIESSLERCIDSATVTAGAERRALGKIFASRRS